MKTKISIIVFLLAFTFIVLPQTKIRNDKARNKIEQINKSFAKSFSDGNINGMISCYAKDATFFPSGMKEAVGKDSIKIVFTNWLAQGKVKFSTKTQSLIFKQDMAIEVGAYDMLFTPTGKKAYQDVGKYIIVWKQTRKDTWKIYYDIYNSNIEN